MYQITCRFDRKNHFIHVNLLGFFLDSLEILECFCLSYTFLVNFVHQRILLQSDICLEVIEKRYKVIVTLQVITTQINSLVVSSWYLVHITKLKQVGIFILIYYSCLSNKQVGLKKQVGSKIHPIRSTGGQDGIFIRLHENQRVEWIFFQKRINGHVCLLER